MAPTALYQFYGCMMLLFQLPEMAMLFYVTGELQMEPAVYAFTGAFSTLPWIFKMVWGAMLDRYVDKMSLDRWCALCYGAWLSAWLVLLCVPPRRVSPALFALASAVLSWSVVVMDVLVDSLMVTMVRDDESEQQSGTIQSRVWQWRAAGGLVGAVLGGVLAQHIGWRGVFVLSALLWAPSLWWMRSSRSFRRMYNNRCDLCATRRQLRSAQSSPAETLCSIARRMVTSPSLKPVLTFVLALGFVPSIGVYLQYFLVDHELSAMALGMVDFANHVARLVGAFLFERTLRDVPFRRIFCGALFLLLVLRLTLLLYLSPYITEKFEYLVLSCIDSFAQCTVTQVLFLPILVFAANQTTRGQEGTEYALLMSFTNFTDIISTLLGSVLGWSLGIGMHDFRHLGACIVISAGMGALPLLLLRGIPRDLTSVNSKAFAPPRADSPGVRHSDDQVENPVAMETEMCEIET